MIIKKTIHRSYPKPDVNNSLQDDVANIENALDMIDSDIQALKTKIEATPPIPVLSSSDITITSFTLSWPRVIEATYYCLDIATDETFSTFIAEYNNKKISETSLNITGLESNTVYYCRIRSAFNLVNSGNSTIHMVRTPLNLIEKSQTFNYTGSMETWTVPQYVTALTIEAWGAQGALNKNDIGGGRGARMQGDFAVTTGQQLKILVGQQGLKIPTCNASAGGGGSFVVRVVPENGFLMSDGTRVEPLIIAGGGGGVGANGDQPGMPGQTGTAGSKDNRGLGQGGENGYGGLSSSGGGGGGFLGSGSTPIIQGCPGTSFLLGGAGGYSNQNYEAGGYGGGGGHQEWNGGGGGGGGYSGGAGGVESSGFSGGGGGGSYNAGTSQNNSTDIKTGHGKVIFRWLGLA